MKRIFITRGHHPPQDNGAYYAADKVKETDKIGPFTAALMDVIAQLPSELSSSIELMPWVDINSKCKAINQRMATLGLSSADALVIDIHFDVASDAFIKANPLYGGIYYGSVNGKAKAEELLKSINKTIHDDVELQFWLRDHSTHRDGSLGIIRMTKPVSILLEAGFVAGPISKSSNVFVGLINFIVDNLKKGALPNG